MDTFRYGVDEQDMSKVVTLTLDVIEFHDSHTSRCWWERDHSVIGQITTPGIDSHVLDRHAVLACLRETFGPDAYVIMI